MPHAQDPAADYRWDDLRVFLALARGGSLAAAAARLGVDATTVGRRLTALEVSLGQALFDRTRDGVKVTPAGARLIPLAEAAEQAAQAVLDEAQAVDRAPEGLVRLAVPPVVAELVVVPMLSALLTRYPKLRLALDGTTAVVDLARREADLALRPTKPDHGDLVCRKLVDSTYGAFASPQLASALGTISHLGAAPWVGWTTDLAEIPAARWARAHLDDARIVLRAGALTTHLAAAHAGVGVALVPGPVGIAQGLVRLRAEGDAAERLATLPTEALWLVAHRALRDVPRVAAVWDFFVEQASPLRDAAVEAEDPLGA